MCGGASRKERWRAQLDAPNRAAIIDITHAHGQEDCGFTYYTRYFRGREPDRRGPVLMPVGTVSVLTLPGDNGTWSVTLFTSSGDQPLKNLRHADKWTNAIRSLPLQAHWLEGEAITDVLPMSGIMDRYRRFVTDGSPVATGFVAVADAWACTNPSAGRGLTVGFLHARVLRDVLRDEAERPRDLVEEFDRRTEAQIAPWYHAQIAVDRTRIAEMDALRAGHQPPPPASDLARGILLLMAATGADPDLFRVALEYIGTITPPQELLKRPGIAEQLGDVGEAMKGGPPPMPGPNRGQLIELVK